MRSHTFDQVLSFPSVTVSFIQINNELLISAFESDLRLVFPQLCLRTVCVDVEHDLFSFTDLFPRFFVLFSCLLWNALLCFLLPREKIWMVNTVYFHSVSDQISKTDFQARPPSAPLCFVKSACAFCQSSQPYN